MSYPVEAVARPMIYRKWSMDGLMLWIHYGLMSLWLFGSLEEIYARHLASPGAKSYSRDEALKLFEDFTHAEIPSSLAHGELLESSPGQRHQGFPLTIASLIWSRWFIRCLFPNFGLTIAITVCI